MTKRRIIIFVLIILGAVYLLIAQIYGNKRLKRNFKSFNESQIIGEIEEIGIKQHGTGFRIKNDSIDYVFYPITSKINEKKILYQIAEKGDSIVKFRYSDTLILIKRKEKYKYTFQKTEYE